MDASQRRRWMVAGRKAQHEQGCWCATRVDQQQAAGNLCRALSNFTAQAIPTTDPSLAGALPTANAFFKECSARRVRPVVLLAPLLGNLARYYKNTFYEHVKRVSSLPPQEHSNAKEKGNMCGFSSFSNGFNCKKCTLKVVRFMPVVWSRGLARAMKRFVLNYTHTHSHTQL